MSKFSFKYFLLQLIKKFDEDGIFALASQLAYSLILAFFPFLIFLMNIIGFLSLDSNQVLLTLSTLLPENAYELILSTVLDVINSQNGNLLSFSLILSIWSASMGFAAVIRGLNKAYNEKEKRGIIKVTMISILCTFGLTLAIIITLTALVFGNIIGHTIARNLMNPRPFWYLWNILRYVIIVVTMIFLFAALYHYTPSKRLTWNDVLPGAVFTTVGWVVASLGFSFYVNNFANYSRLYGSIGGVIVLMVWIFLTSLIILIGGEINAILSYNKK